MRKQGLVRFVLGGFLVMGLMSFSSPVRADDTDQLKQQVQALQERVSQLESQLANKQQAVVPTPSPVYEDPFTQMMLMRQQMDRQMHQALVDSGAFNPKMDMRQTDKAYLISMDIPGMDKDKINVEIKRNMLIISGERRSDSEDNNNSNNNQYYRQERSFGTFMQAIPLPEDAKADHIDAKYKNGVLTVTVERKTKEEKKSESEKITVN